MKTTSAPRDFGDWMNGQGTKHRPDPVPAPSAPRPSGGKTDWKSVKDELEQLLAGSEAAIHDLVGEMRRNGAPDFGFGNDDDQGTPYLDAVGTGRPFNWDTLVNDYWAADGEEPNQQALDKFKELVPSQDDLDAILDTIDMLHHGNTIP